MAFHHMEALALRPSLVSAGKNPKRKSTSVAKMDIISHKRFSINTGSFSSFFSGGFFDFAVHEIGQAEDDGCRGAYCPV
jgi:hypothetical protein